MTKIFGIDISKWQKNYPYEKAKKEGVKFAILRAGYSTTKDSEFETHYKNAKKMGWNVGAYWYTYATNENKAKLEANSFLKVLKNKQFEYPVYIDVEDKTLKNLSKDKLNKIIETFCEIVENSGYYVGVYTNLDWYKNKINGKELNKKYDWWIAQWSSNQPSDINYGLWQFGGETNKIRSNKIGGITTDQNYCFKDYPSIMKSKGLNGYSKSTNTNKEEKKETTKKDNTITYVVKKGDTLSSIAKKYNTTWQKIYNSNKSTIGNNPNLIKVGIKLKIS